MTILMLGECWRSRATPSILTALTLSEGEENYFSFDFDSKNFRDKTILTDLKVIISARDGDIRAYLSKTLEWPYENNCDLEVLSFQKQRRSFILSINLLRSTLEWSRIK